MTWSSTTTVINTTSEMSAQPSPFGEGMVKFGQFLNERIHEARQLRFECLGKHFRTSVASA